MEQQNSIFGTTANIIANLVGAGLLSLPATLSQAGLVPGIALQLLMCVLNTTTMLLIAHSCELSKRFTYKEQGVFALGKPAAIAITAVLALYTLGSLISFVVLIGDNLPALVCENGCHGAVQSLFGDRTVAIVLSAALVLLPLSLLRNLSGLRFTSTLSTVCILYIGLMIGVRCMADSPPRAPISEINIGSSNPLRALATAPVTAVAYCLHYNSARYYYELRDRSMRRFTVATLSGFGLVGALYLLTAICGYLLFGSATKGDVLENFPSNDIPAVVARVAIVCIVLGCYPLAFNAHRTNVTLLLPASWQQALAAAPLPADAKGGGSATEAQELGQALLAAAAPSLQSDAAAPPASSSNYIEAWCATLRASAPHALLTLALVAVSVAVGIAVPDVEVVLAYKGALGGSWIIYVFPGAAWFALCQMHAYAASTAEGGPSDAELSAVPLRDVWRPRDVLCTRRGWLMLVLVAWGLTVLFVGTITTAMGL